MKSCAAALLRPPTGGVMKIAGPVYGVGRRGRKPRPRGRGAEPARADDPKVKVLACTPLCHRDRPGATP